MPTHRRSIARKLDKEYEVARLYFKEHMKPSQIAKKVRLGSEQVSVMVANMKRSAKSITGKVDIHGVFSNGKASGRSAEEQVKLAISQLEANMSNKKRNMKMITKNSKQDSTLVLN